MLKLLVSINDRLDNPGLMSSDASSVEPDEGITITRLENMEEFNTFEKQLHETAIFNVVVSFKNSTY